MLNFSHLLTPLQSHGGRRREGVTKKCPGIALVMETPQVSTTTCRYKSKYFCISAVQFLIFFNTYFSDSFII